MDGIWIAGDDPVPAPGSSPGTRPSRWHRGRSLVAALLLLGGGALLAYALTQEQTPAERRVGRATSPFPVLTAGGSPGEGGGAAALALVPTTWPAGALPTGCGPWDPAFGFEPEGYEGVAIWSDFDGWHVRLAPGSLASVTGTVVGQVTPAVIGDVPPQVLVAPGEAAGTLAFTIDAGDAPAGFSFSADCAQKQFAFELFGPDGTPVPLEQVRIGRAGALEAAPIVAQRSPEAGG